MYLENRIFILKLTSGAWFAPHLIAIVEKRLRSDLGFVFPKGMKTCCSFHAMDYEDCKRDCFEHQTNHENDMKKEQRSHEGCR